MSELVDSYSRMQEQVARDYVTSLLKEQLRSKRIWQALDMADWQRQFDVLLGTRDPREPVVYYRADS